MSVKINFKVTGMKTFVGIEIDRNREQQTITLRQTRYVEALASKHLDLENLKAYVDQLDYRTLHSGCGDAAHVTFK